MMKCMNPYYRMYKIAKRCTDQNADLRLTFTTSDAKKRDPCRYNLPTALDVGIIINKDFADVTAT